MTKLAILGGGNLGRALALGWVRAGPMSAADIAVTRRDASKLSDLAEAGHPVGSDNPGAVRDADVVVLAVQPQQLQPLLDDVAPVLDAARAMPNTAVSIGESMTCLAADEAPSAVLTEATELFDALGRTLVIAEEMMIPATALCACGVAFFLRSVRAASQGGIEIGFHPEEALVMAAQTAKGAAALSLAEGAHPEEEIDRVTTPRGCTIAGLNEMEHQGFSSAMIRGITVSANAAEQLYQG